MPLLAHVAGQVGDPQVRHRGTIGGSIAHGDPASDLPAAVLALGGTLVGPGPGRDARRSPAAEFFHGFLETALAPDELLTEIRVPKMGGAGWSFQKFNRRAQDWAIVGVAAVGHRGRRRHRPGQHGAPPRCGPRRASRRAAGGAVAAEAGGPRRRRAWTRPPDLNATPSSAATWPRVLDPAGAWRRSRRRPSVGSTRS